MSGTLRGVLDAARSSQAEQIEPVEQVSARPEPAAKKPARVKEAASARTAGKSSNPEYKRVMVLLEKKTAKTAGRKWEDSQPDKDFSDLVQGLLAAYNAGQIRI